jgi:hypothetical protein
MSTAGPAQGSSSRRRALPATRPLWRLDDQRSSWRPSLGGEPVVRDSGWGDTPSVVAVARSRVCRRAERRSFSTCARLLPAIEGRATRISRRDRGRAAWWSRKDSRISRLARLRTTAQPTFRLTTTPRRGGSGSSPRAQFRTKHPRLNRRPLALIPANSLDSLMRCRGGRPNEPWEDAGMGSARKDQTGDNRFRPLRRRRAMTPRPLFEALRARKPYCRFRRCFDG